MRAALDFALGSLLALISYFTGVWVGRRPPDSDDEEENVI